MEDCIEYMATAPDEADKKRKRSTTVAKSSKVAKPDAQNLLDIEDSEDTGEGETDSDQDDEDEMEASLSQEMVSSFKPSWQLFREFKSALESTLLELLGTSDIPSDWDKPFQHRYKIRRADQTCFCHSKHVFVCLMRPQAWLCALDTEGSRQSAKLLRGRTACVDITEAEWNTGGVFKFFYSRTTPA